MLEHISKSHSNGIVQNERDSSDNHAPNVAAQDLNSDDGSEHSHRSTELANIQATESGPKGDIEAPGSPNESPERSPNDPGQSKNDDSLSESEPPEPETKSCGIGAILGIVGGILASLLIAYICYRCVCNSSGHLEVPLDQDNYPTLPEAPEPTVPDDDDEPAPADDQLKQSLVIDIDEEISFWKDKPTPMTSIYKKVNGAVVPVPLAKPDTPTLRQNIYDSIPRLPKSVQAAESVTISNIEMRIQDKGSGNCDSGNTTAYVGDNLTLKCEGSRLYVSGTVFVDTHARDIEETWVGGKRRGREPLKNEKDYKISIETHIETHKGMINVGNGTPQIHVPYTKEVVALLNRWIVSRYLKHRDKENCSLEPNWPYFADDFVFPKE